MQHAIPNRLDPTRPHTPQTCYVVIVGMNYYNLSIEMYVNESLSY